MVYLRIRKIDGILALLIIIGIFVAIFSFFYFFWRIILFIILFFMFLRFIKNITFKMNENMLKEKNNYKNSTKHRDHNQKKSNKDIIDVTNYKIK